MSSLLTELNQAQRYAVTLGSGPILVIAGAGTGKTRTLVHRVAWLVEQGQDPESILLLTFTRRAAEEMLERARGLHPACAAVAGGTFHSLAHRLLRRHGALLGLEGGFTVMDQADCQQMLRTAVEDLGLKERGDRRFPKPATLADLVSKSRNLELSLEDTVESQAPHLLAYLEEIRAAARAFQESKQRFGLLDFDDLLFFCEDLLRQHRDLRQRLQETWRHLLVDEYQDTNAVQARLVELLAGPEKNVMAVGDDAQSIYAFRGARLENILEFPQRFAGTRLVKLEENYRSTQAILDLANALIARAQRSYQKSLYSSGREGPRPRLLRPREQRGQSRQALEHIQELLDRGVPPAQIAVLFRSGRDSFDLEAALKQARIPFRKYGGVRFVELAHIKDFMAHLRVVDNPRDFLAWQRLLMLIPGVGPKTAQNIIAHLVADPDPRSYAQRLAQAPQAGRFPSLGELSRLLAELGREGLAPEEAVAEALDYYRPICEENYEDYPRRLRDLDELPALAQPYQSLGDFVAAVVLDPPEEAGEDPASQPITLSTIHSAKGKEWQEVLVLWVTDGRLPAFPSLDDPIALEEERRLFYVACTRAGNGLTLLAPREQFIEGSGWRAAQLSRFLDELEPGLLEAPAAGPVFPVSRPGRAPARPVRGIKQEVPFAVGSLVEHQVFGRGKVMGYQGKAKVMVHFGQKGLKILLVEHAGLEAVSGAGV